jgi:hypothetical protein
MHVPLQSEEFKCTCLLETTARLQPPCMHPACHGKAAHAWASAACAHARTGLTQSVQDTIVTDPFYHHVPPHFGMTFKELLAAKHPTTWVEFEKGQCTESEAMQNFWKGGTPVEVAPLREMMVRMSSGSPDKC